MQSPSQALGTFDEIVKLILSIDPTVAFQMFADTFRLLAKAARPVWQFPEAGENDFLHLPKPNLV